MIENWKSAHKMYSVQIAAIVAFLAGLEPFIPQLAAFLPDGWVSFAVTLIVVARLVSQKKLAQSTPQNVWDEAMAMKERAKK